MGVSVVACLCCLGIMCAKRRRRAKEELQTSIEMANFYESAGTGARSAQSPPPPGLSQVVPAAATSAGAGMLSRHARGEKAKRVNDKRSADLMRNKAKKRKKRKQNEAERRQRNDDKPVKKKKKKKKKKRKKKNDDDIRKRSKSSSSERTNRRGEPLPARRKIRWEHRNEKNLSEEEAEAVTTKQEEEDRELTLRSEETANKMKVNEKKAKKMIAKRAKRAKKKREKSKKSKADRREDEEASVNASDDDVGGDPGDVATVVDIVGSEIARRTLKQEQDLPPTPKHVGESVAIDVNSQPQVPTPPPRRPGGALRGSLPSRQKSAEKIKPDTTSIASQLQDLVSPQREYLRRTTISLSVVSSPDPDLVGDTVGPVVLHMRSRVASIGSAEGPLKVFGDSNIEEEHGLISYRADAVLYVNTSGAPTMIDGQAIDSASPVALEKGSVLRIGNTQLLVTSFTEFVDQ